MIEKEEAIKIFQDKLNTMEHGAICCNFGIDKDAFLLAIQLLKQEPCEDAISRQAVLDSIHANCVYENEYNLTAKHIEDAVKQLPSVKPQIICPIHGVDCEDCSAYEKKLNKWIGAEVLDKIRAEIEHMIPCSKETLSMKLGVLEIIDKYIAESEEKE